MAVDEAIAAHAGRGDVPPTLRFYRWQPACVSLGRHQPLADIDLARCAALGYDVVRRPTGGRAILHTDELTYSVAGPQSDPVLAGAVLDSYLRLSQGLLAGLEQLGLRVAKAPPSNRASTDAGPVCFEVPSAYEIVAGGKKLVGSAESRRQGWVLQHGTLPLVGDVTRWWRWWSSPARPSAPLSERRWRSARPLCKRCWAGPWPLLRPPKHWPPASAPRWTFAWSLGS